MTSPIPHPCRYCRYLGALLVPISTRAYNITCSRCDYTEIFENLEQWHHPTVLLFDEAHEERVLWNMSSSEFFDTDDRDVALKLTSSISIFCKHNRAIDKWRTGYISSPLSLFYHSCHFQTLPHRPVTPHSAILTVRVAAPFCGPRSRGRC